MSTVEHVSRYLVHLGEALAQEALKAQLFSLSLSGRINQGMDQSGEKIPFLFLHWDG